VVQSESSTGYRLLKEAHLSDLGKCLDIAILCLELTMIWRSPIVSGVGCHSFGPLYVGTLLFSLCDPGRVFEYIVAWRLIDGSSLYCKGDV